MNDNWWAIGQTLKAREQDIRNLFERTYFRDAGSRGRRGRKSRRPDTDRLAGPAYAYACAEPAPCC
jgi:hypothetical protein